MSRTLLHPNLERVALARSSQLTEHSRAFWGIMACLLVHGLVVSTWVSRIASVKSALHLGDGALGLALLGHRHRLRQRHPALGRTGGAPRQPLRQFWKIVPRPNVLTAMKASNRSSGP